LVVVAVTVRCTPTFWAGEKENVALPEASVLTDFCPRNFLPSSVPEGLEKNWILKVLLGVLFSLPRTVVEVAEVLAEESTGLSCKPFGPVSASPGSLAVGPSSTSRHGGYRRC